MTEERDLRMIHRRTVILTSVAAALAAVNLPFRAAGAQSASEKAAAFVRETGEKLVAVVNGPGAPQQKRGQLSQVIDKTVDVDSVARFCLGRFWRQASPEQQRRYLELFREVLITNISSKLGDYQGVRFTMGRAVQDGENARVSTVVERPNNPPTAVDWIVESPATDPKIVDVVAEGTSLRLTQRSDYASYLLHNNNNIDALISAMRQQVTQNQASG